MPGTKPIIGKTRLQKRLEQGKRKHRRQPLRQGSNDPEQKRRLARGRKLLATAQPLETQSSRLPRRPATNSRSGSKRSGHLTEQWRAAKNRNGGRGAKPNTNRSVTSSQQRGKKLIRDQQLATLQGPEEQDHHDNRWSLYQDR
ncbi:MAG TPA: hypothetical protein DIW77_02840 [Chromatiaceae bacterium]|nr:MAG: hypothetical protein N838_01550 [Thiohalocapsa sp. PB-PSB1]HCS89012.1 hypothetical protein [Chromatiaceae bacterium]